MNKHGKMKNFFDIPQECRQPDAPERFDCIIEGDGGLLVERIVSPGQPTPEGIWYEQERDEWVLVVEGEAVIGYENGSTVKLARGEHLLLPRKVRHRVASCSSPCIWLAVHGNLHGC